MSLRNSKRKQLAAQEAQVEEQAILSTTIASVLSDPSKGTDEMRASLQEMQSLLACPLCQSIFSDPVSLSCGHSFCRRCISLHNCSDSQCPIPDCRLPVSLNKGSFQKVHPTLQTVIDSFTIICQTLNQAEGEWWKGSNNEEDDPTKELDGDDETAEEGLDEGKMIDLDNVSVEKDEEPRAEEEETFQSAKETFTLSPSSPIPDSVFHYD